MPTPSTTPFSILLIDDDEVDIKNVIREFQPLKQFVEFHIAKTGIEALDKLYGKNGETKINPPPKAIILDTNMPQMNGIEFLSKLRTDSDFDNLYVFMLTNEYSTREKLATHHLSVTQRIVKPLKHEDVLQIYWILLGRPIDQDE